MAVDNPVLVRFFSLHFLLPFVITAIRLIHLIYLHKTGSRNPLGVSRSADKVFFHPYFRVKDLAGFFFTLLFLFYIVGFFP